MKLNKNEITILASEFDDQVEKLKTIFETIASCQSKLEKIEAWEGEAANYYNENFKKIISEFDSIYSGLKNNGQFLASVPERFNKADKEFDIGYIKIGE